MITDFVSLKACMGGFSTKHYQVTPKEYREFFLGGIRSGRLDKEKIREELEVILSEEIFSLKELAASYEVFFYDAGMTEDDVRVTFQLLTWDVLFPKKLLSPEKIEQLKVRVVKILKKEKEVNSVKSVHIDDITMELEEEKEWSNLSRLDLLHMQQVVGQREIELEYFIPELWFFKLSQFAVG